MADYSGEIMAEFVIIGAFEELVAFLDSFEGLILRFIVDGNIVDRANSNVVTVTARKSAANIPLKVVVAALSVDYEDNNLVEDITLDGMNEYYIVLTADTCHICCDMGAFDASQLNLDRGRMAVV
ncbi:hypothetical protein N7463_010385 [Penicillium fimorum]|uniref:Uncharacterized protein n=1 Tax=Penicillium fimorum TaxID=1882269 RepID=A0A9W9XJT7_9EURO|nr:hypothetical protein N7463_010385 [Penicillium fimorum]